MPAFKSDLTDTQMAMVLSYIRASWGNKAAAVTTAQVTQARIKASAVLRQHGLGDYQLTHQVDQLIHLVHSHPDRRRFHLGLTLRLGLCRRLGNRWLNACGHGRRSHQRGGGLGGRARRIMKETIGHFCCGAGWRRLLDCYGT